ILLVEDDRTARSMLPRAFEQEGWDVTEAENGLVALECVEEDPPDLIVLDLLMPELDGLEFAAALQKSDELRAIPIVVHTGKELAEEDRARLTGQVVAVVQKGKDSRQSLLTTIRERVDIRAHVSDARG
ncbi:MAG: response regulator, partial [Longimicrobiales bacterium]